MALKKEKTADILDFEGIYDFKTKKHVDWMYTAFGMLAFLTIATIVGSETWWPLPFAVLVGALIFSMQNGVEIDTTGRSYKEYTTILGWKKGSKEKFEEVEYLFITSRGQAHTSNFASMQATVKYKEFLGTIKFS